MLRFLGLLFFCSLGYGSDRIEVKKAFSEKNYKVVIQLYSKYPSLFQEERELYWLAQSYLKTELKADAVMACAMALEVGSSDECRSLIRSVKASEPLDWSLGMGLHYARIQDLKRAVMRFAEVIEKGGVRAEIARLRLLKMFRASGQYEHIQELVWLSDSENADIRGYQKDLDGFVKGWNRLLPKEEAKLVSNKDALYRYLLLAQKDWAPYTDQFIKKIQADFGSGQYTEKDVIRLGHLLLIKNQVKQAEEWVKKAGPNVGQPLYRIGLDALNFRLKMALEASATTTGVKTDKNVKKIVVSVPVVLPTSSLPNLGNITTMNLKPFDFSELATADPSDLSPYKKVYQEFQARMKDNPSEYEKRFIYKQLDQAYDSFRDNPKASPALMAYHQSPEGQEFQKQTDALEQEFLKVDQANTKWFAGEEARFDKALEMSKSDTEKLIALKSYASKWDKLVFGDETNLMTQGAAVAFRQTDEGKRLAKKVYDLVTKLKILPADMELPDDFKAERDWN